MKDPVSVALNLLAAGLRPYVAGRIVRVMRDEVLAADVSGWDAQALMVFMWDRWNELFRSELTFVERSLISELRDFRNRWAHQDELGERDVYRILEDTERLLDAIHAPEAVPLSRLRKESLHRLWTEELSAEDPWRKYRVAWPYILCGSSAIAIASSVIAFAHPPWSWLLSLLIFLGLMRIASLQASRESRKGPGPRECGSCGRIVYSMDCPYCVHRTGYTHQPTSESAHRADARPVSPVNHERSL